VIERVWEWRFAASPDELWPVLADTARFNKAIGLPRYAACRRRRDRLVAFLHYRAPCCSLIRAPW
jgi:hypothetical protein